MLGYVRLELARVLRDVTFLVFGVAMPTVMYLIFTTLGLAPGDGRQEVALFIMVSMAAYGGMGSAFNNGTGLGEDRATGWLRQLRLTPLSPTAVLAGKTVTGMVVVVPGIAAVLLAGVLINDVTLRPAQWVAIVALLWLGTIPFTLFGLGNGYRLTGQSAGLANLAATMGLAVAGGLWLPIERFPGWLKAIAQWTPTHNYADIARHVAFGQSPTLRSALILLGWLLVLGMYARYGYRYAGRRA
ncbi:ABC transporter [Sphaerisporangium rufum]|uniref:ABC transporter n=1 Tax=Sphaerisporangium rufum TaxID=1381558 RepID=A0A919R381_9ACTN|nr:ABC transporter permease [Sphaerisporangium rufum]GII78879.1 ABC transporter [Sphaerisporangium rufum]